MKTKIRKLTKTGGGRSYTVVLPRQAIRNFGWKEHQKLTIKIDPKKKRFIIEDWKK